ncbi:MAG: hypothetical protein R2867_18360 [Caldilineaceae bacterium]
MEILCAALANTDWFVRREAVESLGRIGNPTPAVIEALLALLVAGKPRHKRIVNGRNNSPIVEDEEDVRAMLAALQEGQSLRGDVAMTLAQLGCINDAVIATFLADLATKGKCASGLCAIGGCWARITRRCWRRYNRTQDASAMVRKSAAASLQRLGIMAEFP